MANENMDRIREIEDLNARLAAEKEEMRDRLEKEKEELRIRWEKNAFFNKSLEWVHELHFYNIILPTYFINLY